MYLLQFFAKYMALVHHVTPPHILQYPFSLKLTKGCSECTKDFSWEVAESLDAVWYFIVEGVSTQDLNRVQSTRADIRPSNNEGEV